MLRLILRIAVLAGIIYLVTYLMDGIHVYGGVWTYVWIAVLFSVVNAVIGPILKILGLPFIVLTLGLFLLVINAGLLGIVAALSSKFDIDGFWWAVGGSLLISLFSWAAEQVLPIKAGDSR